MSEHISHLSQKQTIEGEKQNPEQLKAQLLASLEADNASMEFSDETIWYLRQLAEQYPYEYATLYAYTYLWSAHLSASDISKFMSKIDNALSSDDYFAAYYALQWEKSWLAGKEPPFPPPTNVPVMARETWFLWDNRVSMKVYVMLASARASVIALRGNKNFSISDGLHEQREVGANKLVLKKVLKRMLIPDFDITLPASLAPPKETWKDPVYKEIWEGLQDVPVVNDTVPTPALLRQQAITQQKTQKEQQKEQYTQTQKTQMQSDDTNITDALTSYEKEQEIACILEQAKREHHTRETGLPVEQTNAYKKNERAKEILEKIEEARTKTSLTNIRPFTNESPSAETEHSSPDTAVPYEKISTFDSSSRDAAAWMSDALEWYTPDLSIHAYYRAYPEMKSWKMYLLKQTNSTKQKQWISRKIADHKQSLPMGSIYVWVTDNALLPVLTNSESVITVPDISTLVLIDEQGNRTPALQSEYTFSVQKDQQTDQFRLQTDYTWMVEYELVLWEVSNKQPYMPTAVRSRFSSTLSPGGMQCTDIARQLVDAGDYHAAIDYVRSYMVEKFEYTTFGELFHPDPVVRDTDPDYMYGDCDVLAEQLQIYLGMAGIYSEIQSCYMDSNMDEACIGDESHAILKAILPDGSVEYIEATQGISLASFQPEDRFDGPSVLENKSTPLETPPPSSEHQEYINEQAEKFWEQLFKEIKHIEDTYVTNAEKRAAYTDVFREIEAKEAHELTLIDALRYSRIYERAMLTWYHVYPFDQEVYRVLHENTVVFPLSIADFQHTHEVVSGRKWYDNLNASHYDLYWITLFSFHPTLWQWSYYHSTGSETSYLDYMVTTGDAIPSVIDPLVWDEKRFLTHDGVELSLIKEKNKTILRVNDKEFLFKTWGVRFDSRYGKHVGTLPILLRVDEPWTSWSYVLIDGEWKKEFNGVWRLRVEHSHKSLWHPTSNGYKRVYPTEMVLSYTQLDRLKSMSHMKDLNLDLNRLHSKWEVTMTENGIWIFNSHTWWWVWTDGVEYQYVRAEPWNVDWDGSSQYEFNEKEKKFQSKSPTVTMSKDIPDLEVVEQLTWMDYFTGFTYWNITPWTLIDIPWVWKRPSVYFDTNTNQYMKLCIPPSNKQEYIYNSSAHLHNYISTTDPLFSKIYANAYPEYLHKRYAKEIEKYLRGDPSTQTYDTYISEASSIHRQMRHIEQTYMQEIEESQREELVQLIREGLDLENYTIPDLDVSIWGGTLDGAWSPTRSKEIQHLKRWSPERKEMVLSSILWGSYDLVEKPHDEKNFLTWSTWTSVAVIGEIADILETAIETSLEWAWDLTNEYMWKDIADLVMMPIQKFMDLERVHAPEKVQESAEEQQRKKRLARSLAQGIQRSVRQFYKRSISRKEERDYHVQSKLALTPQYQQLAWLIDKEGELYQQMKSRMTTLDAASTTLRAQYESLPDKEKLTLYHKLAMYQTETMWDEGDVWKQHMWKSIPLAGLSSEFSPIWKSLSMLDPRFLNSSWLDEKFVEGGVPEKEALEKMSIEFDLYRKVLLEFFALPPWGRSNYEIDLHQKMTAWTVNIIDKKMLEDFLAKHMNTKQYDLSTQAWRDEFTFDQKRHFLKSFEDTEKLEIMDRVIDARTTDQLHYSYEELLERVAEDDRLLQGKYWAAKKY